MPGGLAGKVAGVTGAGRSLSAVSIRGRQRPAPIMTA